MKIRCGFISNSSSCSFIMDSKDIEETKRHFNEFNEKIQRILDNSDDYHYKEGVLRLEDYFEEENALISYLNWVLPSNKILGRN